jgi:hypothetical protein
VTCKEIRTPNQAGVSAPRYSITAPADAAFEAYEHDKERQ